MGRRHGTYKHCVPRRWSANQYPYEGDAARGMVETWCGERRSWERATPLDSPRLASCTKCSQAIGKAKLKGLPRLELVKDETPCHPYARSSYSVLIDGELRGYVACNNGWGAHWSLYQVGEQRGYYSARYVTGKSISGDPVDVWDAKRWPTEGEHVRTFWPVHWASKEAMAAAAFTAWQAGQLPTLEEQATAEAARLKKAQADKVEAAARAAERERERLEARRIKDERLEAWRLAYADLAARVDLSNLERAGIEAAQALITGS